MQVWSFASGSDGNCYLVESEGTSLLVECGRPYSQIRDLLDGAGLSFDDLSGIVLTHAHGDHSRSARYLSQTHRVPIYASRGTLGALALEDIALGKPLESGKTYVVGQMDLRPFAVPHDCREPLGFRFESGSGRAAIATDLGWVPSNVAKHFRDVDLLIVEANYDPHLLHTGTYPYFLKQRVSGTYGHLSNAAAGEAIAACRDRPPSAVWLAHLSEHNNSPKHALQTVNRILRRSGLGHVQIKTTHHRRSTLRWTSAVARERQLPLFA
ncbi:MAG: MBL fold metallo-hydrolase [Chloroflexi bacterium]|nr:MBL fold metallo-hydrolase [Chloroflexota bacterium]